MICCQNCWRFAKSIIYDNSSSDTLTNNGIIDVITNFTNSASNPLTIVNNGILNGRAASALSFYDSYDASGSGKIVSAGNVNFINTENASVHEIESIDAKIMNNSSSNLTKPHSASFFIVVRVVFAISSNSINEENIIVINGLCPKNLSIII